MNLSGDASDPTDLLEQERQEKYGMTKTVFWIYWVIMIAGVGTLLKLLEWAILFGRKSVGVLLIKLFGYDWFSWHFSSDVDLSVFLTFWRWVISVLIAGWLTWKLNEARWKNPRMWKKEEPKPTEPPKFFTGN